MIVALVSVSPLSQPVTATPLPFRSDSILVSSGDDDGRLAEFSRDGTRLQRFSFDYPSFGNDSFPKVRDVLVSPNGKANIVSGGSAVQLITLDPTINLNPLQSQLSFSSFPFWNIGANISCGASGIDRSGRIYVPDIVASSNPADIGGIYRFDSNLQGGVHFAEPFQYARVTVGLNGLIYGLRDSNGAGSFVVDAYDPITLLKQSEVNIASVAAITINDLAVSESGR